ncbi:MAG: hypothetical protein VB093_14200 [Propionicimonas sp.]|nr:hypothetical protein [Propionicimonas sp.]
MTSATWITRGDLAGLACPYCGRTVRPDADWAVAAQHAWGRVGVALSSGSRTSGLMLLAPSPQEQAAMVMCLWVAPGSVRRGYGRRLVQAGAAGMLARDVHAIVARGSRVKKHCSTPPTEFLKAVGFTKPLDGQLGSALRPSPTLNRPGHASDVDDTRLNRLWRLDLDATIVERPGLFEMLQQWVGSIRPIGPAAAGRVSREG